jgi:hypothetical protein
MEGGAVAGRVEPVTQALVSALSDLVPHAGLSAAHHGFLARQLAQLAEVATLAMPVPLLGQSQVGKSTLINALVGRRVLAAGGVGPLTSHETVVRGGRENALGVTYVGPGQLKALAARLRDRHAPDFDDVLRRAAALADQPPDADPELISTVLRSATEAALSRSRGTRIAAIRERLGTHERVDPASVRTPVLLRRAIAARLHDWTAAIVERIEVTVTDSPASLTVIDLPGIGTFADPRAEVATRFLTPAPELAVVVVRNSGLTNDVCAVLRHTGILELLRAQPERVVVVVTHLDEVARERSRSDGVTRSAALPLLRLEVTGMVRRQLAALLADASAGATSERVAIHAVVAMDHLALVGDEPAETALNRSDAGIDALRAHLEALACNWRQRRRAKILRTLFDRLQRELLDIAPLRTSSPSPDALLAHVDTLRDAETVVGGEPTIVAGLRLLRRNALAALITEHGRTRHLPELVRSRRGLATTWLATGHHALARAEHDEATDAEQRLGRARTRTGRDLPPLAPAPELQP